MAYPDSIKLTGALSLQDDVFEYFKGAFYNGGNPLMSNTNNHFLEKWPVAVIFSDTYGTIWDNYPISFPMTRTQFRNWIKSFTVTTDTSNAAFNNMTNHFKTIYGGWLFNFSEPGSGWPIKAVSDWGKIKSMELAIFGSAKTEGEGGGSDTSLFTSGILQNSILNWEVCSLNYLRYALGRFNSYGTCHPDYIEGPSLEYVGESTFSREFQFRIPSGILVGDTEVSLNNESTWNPVLGASLSGNLVTWPVPAGNYPPGRISIRVRENRGAYIDAGDSIKNLMLYT